MGNIECMEGVGHWSSVESVRVVFSECLSLGLQPINSNAAHHRKREENAEIEETFKKRQAPVTSFLCSPRFHLFLESLKLVDRFRIGEFSCWGQIQPNGNPEETYRTVPWVFLRF